MALGKTLLVAVGAVMLACSGEPDEAIDEHGSSEDGATEEASTDQASSKAADDEQPDADECSGPFDMASPEAAIEAYARLRGGTLGCPQVTRRGKPLTIEYKIN